MLDEMLAFAQWKSASEEEKGTFEAQAAADRARYQKEMEKYNKVCSKKLCPATLSGILMKGLLVC